MCATASCTACVTACPKSAWVMDERSLGFDADACDGCGLCRPACPENAISFAPAAFAPLVDERRATAHVACERAGVASGRGVVACLHALGEREASALAERGVRQVRVARPPCVDCSRSTSQTLAAAIGRTNVLRSSRGARGLTYVEIDAAAWKVERPTATAAVSEIDHARRAFFRLGRSPALPSAPCPSGDVGAPSRSQKFRHVPRIDAAACTGCDACARICPHRAIAHGRGDDGRLGYRFDAAHCTGCRLCMDMCDSGAVSLGELQEVQVARVMLDESTCRCCGVPFHVPVREMAGTAEPVSLCRVCRATDRTRLLFQVHGS